MSADEEAVKRARILGATMADNVIGYYDTYPENEDDFWSGFVGRLDAFQAAALRAELLARLSGGS